MADGVNKPLDTSLPNIFDHGNKLVHETLTAKFTSIGPGVYHSSEKPLPFDPSGSGLFTDGGKKPQFDFKV